VNRKRDAAAQSLWDEVERPAAPARPAHPVPAKATADRPLPADVVVPVYGRLVVQGAAKAVRKAVRQMLPEQVARCEAAADSLDRLGRGESVPRAVMDEHLEAVRRAECGAFRDGEVGLEVNETAWIAAQVVERALLVAMKGAGELGGFIAVMQCLTARLKGVAS
jgi:hypothetical protein